jgi:hypothetical protein
MAAKLAAAGVNNDQIAAFFEVAPKTWDRILARDKRVRDAVKKARAGAVAAMGATLFQRGIRGSDTAAIFYLKTQGLWREKHPDSGAPDARKAIKLNYSLGEDPKNEDEEEENGEEDDEDEDE